MKLFLLHAHYVNSEIQLVCKTVNGTTKCLTVSDWLPYVYAKDSAYRVKEVLNKNIASMTEVKRVQFVGFTNERQQRYIKIRVKRWPLYLKQGVLDVYEDKVKPHTKFLCESGLRSGAWLSFDGVGSSGKLKQFTPLLEDTAVPQLLVMAWDLETSGLDPHVNGIYQVCCVFYSTHTPLTPDERSCVICSQPTDSLKNTRILQATSEIDLLIKFRDIIQQHDPDILTGYNTNSFDQKFLEHRIKHHNLMDSYTGLGRGAPATFKQQILESAALGANQQTLWLLPGRMTLDLFMFCKVNFPTLPNFKLDTASELFVGDKKVSNNMYYQQSLVH